MAFHAATKPLQEATSNVKSAQKSFRTRPYELLLSPNASSCPLRRPRELQAVTNRSSTTLRADFVRGTRESTKVEAHM